MSKNNERRKLCQSPLDKPYWGGPSTSGDTHPSSGDQVRLESYVRPKVNKISTEKQLTKKVN